MEQGSHHYKQNGYLNKAKTETRTEASHVIAFREECRYKTNWATKHAFVSSTFITTNFVTNE